VSALEEMLALEFRANRMTPEREYRFHPTRKWRFDFAFPESRVAVECEGTTWFGKNSDGSMRLGRHQTAKGAAADCEKYNAAAELGWTVLRYPEKPIKSGEAIDQIRRVLSARVELAALL
jgi:very-short-patch-repair endonuclease